MPGRWLHILELMDGAFQFHRDGMNGAGKRSVEPDAGREFIELIMEVIYQSAPLAHAGAWVLFWMREREYLIDVDDIDKCREQLLGYMEIEYPDKEAQVFIFWLGRSILDARWTDVALAGLSDGYDRLRGAAAKALGQIKAGRAVSPLISTR